MDATAASLTLKTSSKPEDIGPEMADTAASRVLNTPELLEHILVQCSTAQVTRARQVSGFFRALIDNSKVLRRIMFLEPEAVGETITHYLTRDPRNGIPDRRIRHIYNTEGEPLIVAKLHPAIGTVSYRGYMKFDAEEWHTKQPNLHWQPGMWRSMTLTQPPCANVEVWCYKLTGSGCFRYQKFTSCPLKDNTLGALVDIWKELYEDDREFIFDSIEIVGFVNETSDVVKVARAKREQDAIDAAKFEAEKIEADRVEREKSEDSGDVIEQADQTDEVGTIIETGVSERCMIEDTH